MWCRRGWSLHRPAALWLAVSLAALASPLPAHADSHCDEEATVGPISGEAGAECDTDDPGTGGGDVSCDPDSAEVAWYADPPADLPDETVNWWEKTILRYGEVEDGYTWLAAYNCAGRYLGGPHLVPDPNWNLIDGLRESARAQIAPPLPSPNVSPSEAVVNMDTWLWVEDAAWQPASATETDGAVTVRVEARPTRVTWDLVEGEHTCDGPGIPWSPQAHDDYEAQPAHDRGTGNPACTYRFRHSSTTQQDGVYHASVTVTWEFAWWVNGEPRGVFGAVDLTSTFDLRVGEIQALITG